MRKICPKCRGKFDAQFLCPTCGVQLVESSNRPSILTKKRPMDSLPAAGMFTRFAAGWLLAQAIYYGVEQLAIGAFMLIGQPEALVQLGEVASPALMLISVVAGSLVAGAGNPRGMAAGAALGLFHAMALIGARFGFGHWPGEMMLFAGWLVLTLTGALAGRVGRHIWPPLSDIQQPEPPATTTTIITSGPVLDSLRRRVPIAWVRVLGGAAVAIACTIYAGQIRDYIIGTSGGKFTVDSRLQVNFVTWVIAALGMLAGGAFAGAATRGGFRHGLLVGFVASAGAFAVQFQVIKEALPAERFFATSIGLPESGAESPARVGLFLLTNAVILGAFGGWFGAALLPRVSGGPKKLDRGSI